MDDTGRECNVFSVLVSPPVTEQKVAEVEIVKIKKSDVLALPSRGHQHGQEDGAEPGEGTGPGPLWGWEDQRRPWEDKSWWLVLVMIMTMHRKEKTGGESDGTTGGAGGGNTAGGFSGVSSNGGGAGGAGVGGGGVAGPSSGGTSGKGASSGGGNMIEVTEVDQFGYPDSPTQTWLAANADLSPLRILDNINLKSEFPYSALTNEVDKPPDISNIGVDSATANLLQFAASVPVPDPTNSFIDISTDNFHSLYEDLGDLIPTNLTFQSTLQPDLPFAENNNFSQVWVI